ncbi:inter-alpha-trypsin inhibitor heavy chain H4-like isoform X3 [Rhynchophorus ferrugineus]|uniref:inter-alpha-trypsin inhibitor heavy chain H4-like isoform X3 n=1 Tax=Rhynchophorus ferrugineus TaxID=354439 RepID=UPI003FCEE01E
MEPKGIGLYLIFLTLLCSVYARSKREYVVTTEKIKESTSENDAEKNANVIPQIYEMLLHTNVSNRYAKTLITSKVKNLNTKAQETTFSIVTPEKAFISGFTMEIDGKKYEAYVKEKEEAKKTYDQAVASGIGAAHVAVSARDSNRFTVSVNIEPQSKATFYLRYEELLVRKTEKYELVLNINPGQPVKKLAVEVDIIESRPLKFVKVPSLRSGNEISKNDDKADPEADIQMVNDTAAVISFNPDVVKQKLLTSILGGKEDNGLSGQFIVQYDVARDPQGGEVLVDGGYFVHFFAPEDLTPLNKQILFVLDTSGSMSGRKIEQLKEAMNSILDELKTDDTFSIVDFNSAVSVWDIEHANISYQEGYVFSFQGYPREEQDSKPLKILPDSFPASPENIKKAKEVVEKLRAAGGTDIQKGLETALAVVNKFFNPKGNQPIIVFLTDGQPTYGTKEGITSTITEQNEYKVPIFALSFGSGADKEFLQKLSLKNQGFARHIYEAADASLQLRNFYQEISSPLLTNVTFKYVDKVKNVTRTHFPILFKGTELCTAGITAVGFEATAVEALGISGPIILEPKVYQSSGSLERLWAYLTVQQLLEQKKVAKDKEAITAKALEIALKYSFVTDITSLVVVKPNATSALDLEDASKEPTFASFNKQYLTTPLFGAGPLYSAPPGANVGGLIASGSASRFEADSLPGAPDIRVTFDEPVWPEISSVSTTPSLPSTTQNPTWIEKVLNNNETLSINEKKYTLGLNEQLGDGKECSNSVNNSTGHCTLLHECPKVHSYLTDLETYKKYFCEQKSYAGVCCPSPSNQKAILG